MNFNAMPSIATDRGYSARGRAKRLLACMSASIGVLALCAPAAALAQDEAGAAAPAEDETRLEEIVVTAQKRVQRLQDVPVAVTALSENSLVTNRVTTIRDLDALVPNLIVRSQVGGSSLPTYTMRGLFALGSAAGADKGVAMYIDGVYLGAASGSSFELADLQRVEVLRGPQGTLFGRNSTAGAISFTTADPTGEFGVKQTFTYGNYDQFRSATTLNLPQWGPFSARLSYTHSERRGDIRNLGAGTVWDFTPAFGGRTTRIASPEWLGSFNNESLGAAILFEPSDNVKATYRFDYSENVYSSSGMGTLYIQPLIRGMYVGQNPALLTPITNERPKAVNNRGVIPSHLKAWGHSLTMEFKPTDNITVKNIAAVRKSVWDAGWQDFSSIGGLVNTGSASFAAVLGPALAASTIGQPVMVQSTSSTGVDEQFSNELQVNYESDFVTLTTGALYYKQKTKRGPYGSDAGLGRARSGAFRVYPNFVVPFTGQATGYLGRETTIRVASYAAFAYGEFHLTDQLDLVGGLRYTKDKKTGLDVSNYSAATPVTSAIDYSGDKVTYNIGVNYKFSNDILVYGKYSTGYISGGALAGIEYEPETAKSWEAGLKADWFDRTLRTNLAVFHVKYGNLQVSTSGAALGRPEVTQALVSAGDAKATGFELETVLSPMRGLTLSGGLGMTDFEFTRLTPIVLLGQSMYLPQQRSKWTANVAVQYESQPLFDDVSLSARVDANWKSKMYTITGVPALSASFTAAEREAFIKAGTVNPYWIVNARVALQGFRVGGTEATLALWARNLLDEDTVNFGQSVVTAVSGDYERARTVGVDLTLAF
jgi:iron complex outermembrane receptor protein